jgi:hypothetical protein
MLGYGALGRETARLLKSHGMRVIAANTSGKATTQDGVSHFVSHPRTTYDCRTWKSNEIRDRVDGSTLSPGQAIKKG